MKVIIFVLIIGLTVIPQVLSKNEPPNNVTVGERFEYYGCDENNTCRRTSYIYQKYYRDSDNEWKYLNDTINNDNCNDKYDYCIVDNNYQIQIKSKPNASQSLFFQTKQHKIMFTPLSLNYRNSENEVHRISLSKDSDVKINKSKFQYDNIFIPKFHLKYDYFPNFLKQEFIIEDNETLPEPPEFILDRPNVTLDIDYLVSYDSKIDIFIDGEKWIPFGSIETYNDIIFKSGKDTIFIFPKPFIEANYSDYIYGKYRLIYWGGDLIIQIKTSYDWIIEESEEWAYDPIIGEDEIFLYNFSRKFPIIIDPTIRLNASNITANYFIQRKLSSIIPIGQPERVEFTVFTNPGTQLRVGVDRICPIICSLNNDTYRSVIEWDHSFVEANMEFTSITTDLRILNVGSGQFTDIQIRRMTENRSFYTNNETFYNASGNFTIYNTTNASSTTHFIWNITTAADDIIAFNKTTWTIGIRSTSESCDTGGNCQRVIIASRDNNNENLRPSQNYTWRVNSCIPVPGKSWEITSFCNITSSIDHCPDSLVIKGLGQVNISGKTTILNVSEYNITRHAQDAFNFVPWRLSLHEGAEFRASLCS